MKIIADKNGYTFYGALSPLRHKNLACLQIQAERALLNDPEKVKECRRVFEEFRSK